MFRKAVLLLLLLWKQGAVNSIRLVELRVPTHKSEGDKALLSCHYDMEGDTLYSLKWYKDSREFYRYVPKNHPPAYYFSARGVHVDISRSSNIVVALINLTQESAGHYRCEVSGEAPLFQTVHRQKYINIHLLPKTGPIITGLQERYNVGDFVVVNCSLPPSRPKAHLKWLVNDEPASAEHVIGPWYRISAERPDAAGTILQLSFRVTDADFVDGAIKLKCQATIPPLYQTETESTHYKHQSIEVIEHTDEPQLGAAIDTYVEQGTQSPVVDRAVITTNTDDAASTESPFATLIVTCIYLILGQNR